MDIIDKIRAEVEKKTYMEQGFRNEDSEYGYHSCARDILYFIDNLKEKESPTDAFIEKAKNFLEMLEYGFTITDNITHTNYDKEQLIKDFKNYIKGE